MSLVEYEKALDDPVAHRTSWSPRAPWLYDFPTHALVQTAPTLWELRLRARMHLAASFLSLVGTAVLVAPRFLLLGRTFTIVLGIGLFVYGLWNYTRETRSVLVDPVAGSLRWRLLFLKSASKRPHALQLLLRRNEGEVFSEINAVLPDGSRERLSCHPDVDDAEQTALKLGNLLRVPTWRRGPGDKE